MSAICKTSFENLQIANLNICPSCNGYDSSHFLREDLVKMCIEISKVEAETTKAIEISKVQAETTKAIEISKVQAETTIEISKVEAEIRKHEISQATMIQLRRLEMSQSSNHLSTTMTSSDTDNYTQCYRDAVQESSVVKPFLSSYGSSPINIVVNDSSNESDICAQVAKIVEEGIGDLIHHSVSSSEGNSWLRMDGIDNRKFKPDLHICSSAFLISKSQVPAGMKPLRSAVPVNSSFVKFIMEGKNIPLNEASRGKLVFYLHLLNSYQPRSYGIIFNATDFVYMKSSNKKICCIEEGVFSSPGSLDYILQKIRNIDIPDIRLHDQALQGAVVQVPILPIGNNSLIGAGRFGLVLKCTDIDNKELAVKLIKLSSDGMGYHDVENEFNKFVAVSAKLPNITLKPKSDLLFYKDLSSGYEMCIYVMEGVGKRVNRKSAKNIFTALVTLHLSGFIHGDPRLANIISYVGSARWIDFRGDMPFSRDNIIRDVRCLMKSLVEFQDIEIDEIVEKLVSYADIVFSGSSVSSDPLEILIDIHSCLQKKSTV